MPATTANPPGRQLTPWLILLLALAVLAAGLGYDRYDAYRKLDAQERQRLVDEANVTKKNLSARLQTSSNALEALRSDLPGFLAQADGLSRLNRRLGALVAATEGLRTLLVVDVNGIAIASNRPELIGKNFREPERYQTMSRDANPDQLYVSAPFKTPLGIWAISLGRVILDDQGRFNGYLLAIVDPDYFRLLLSSTLYAPDMRVSVVHGEGLVVFRTPDPEGLTGQDVRQLPHSFFRRFWDSGAEHLVLEGPSAAPGGERLAALQAIRPRETTADQPLIVTTSRDLAAILAPWKQETWVRLALFALVALVAAIGLGAYQRRQRAYHLLRATEEAKRAATAANLQASERRFRELFQHLPIAYQSVDSEGRWLDANQQLADLLGFTSPEELIGQSFVDYWDATIRDQFAANFARFKTSLSIDGEVPLRRRDGTPLTVLFAGRVQQDEQGRFVRTHCILFDISERRAMEEAVRDLNANLEAKVAERTAELETARDELAQALARMVRSEARFRTMFDQAPLGIALIDSLTGQIHAVNDRFAAIAGRNREEMATIDWMAITHPDDVQEDLDNMARLNAGEIPGFQMNKRYLHPDGAVVWISMTIAPVTREPGQGPRHLCMIEDITERVQKEQRIQETLHLLQEARQAAEAATLAKSEFLAHMSHEIRTPMNGVLGLVQLLQREPLTPDQRDMVTRIQGAGQSLLAILNDILDFSKIEAGQLRLEDRPFRLDALPAKLDSLLGSVARGKGLALRIAGPDADLGPLRGDALRLEQILINLVGNAIKFTAAGEVAVTFTTLASDPAGVRLRCAVRDTGIGIGPEALARLFTPFTQADSSTTRRFGGTGLGLSICKRLVELMGGTLGAESVPGEGSTFWCELPFSRAGDEEVPAPAAPVAALPVGPRLRGLHLLAVDDSAMNRDLVERALKREGAEVTLAGDGQQALLLLQASPANFDAVLMDVQMPIMDGRTATRLIRQELGLTQLPVIALTAGVLAEEQRLIREAGADEVLAKPLDLELLVATLLRLIPAERLSAGSLASPNCHEGARHTPENESLCRDFHANGVADAGALADTGSVAVPLAGAGPRAAAPAGPSARPDDFPLIPGIDPDRAALITGQDPAFFRAQLARLLLRESAGVGAACRQALAAGDRETAARRLHSLKGNAGNLGALDLMRVAGDLETAIGHGAGDLDQGLAALDRQIEDLATASAPWLTATAPPGGTQRDGTRTMGTRPAADQVKAAAPARPADAFVPPAATPAPPLDPDQLTVLRVALRGHDLAASDHFEDLAASLTAAWGAEAVHALGEAIADLRFGEALALVDRQTSGPAA